MRCIRFRVLLSSSIVIGLVLALASAAVLPVRADEEASAHGVASGGRDSR